MTESSLVALLGTACYLMIHFGVLARAIMRPYREPASRVAWVVVIAVVPVLGIIAYLLLGETSIGRRRLARVAGALAAMPDMRSIPGLETPAGAPDIPAHHAHLFQAGQSINGFSPVGGNRARLMADSNAVIDQLVADIDSATEHVHLIFYIWLNDRNGLKVTAALKRAAKRGIACRAMADGLGSRTLIESKHWGAMREAGVQVASALPIGNPLLRPLRGRIDLRNHRKIVVIDNRITYCGSQNCADPEFRVKAKFAPWVDVMLRFEGPIARQNQYLFAADWMAHVDENIDSILTQPMGAIEPGFSAQVIGTGPTVRNSAMPEMFENLIYSARQALFITTPYYVPDESMQAALCASARRGVKTTMIFPGRNDSWIVAAASRSYYAQLLEAGVRLFEYQGGLLHTKSLTMDGDITLVGSANMDRRSFELNYENNILFQDRALTQAMLQQQAEYLGQSKEVTIEMVESWPLRKRLINNAIGMLGPIL